MSNTKGNADRTWKFLGGEEQTFYQNDEAMYTFIAKREKHPQTHEEQLIITCENNSIENGTLVTNLYHLERDIRQFQKYGVALKDIEFSDLAHKIREEYLNIKLEIANIKTIDASVIKGIIELIKEYIEVAFDKDDKEKDKNKEFIIPVKDFEELLTESYKDFSCIEIRKVLAENNYIITQKGRTSKLVRRNGKPTRVIAFDLSKLQG